MRFPNIFSAERRVNELEKALTSAPLFAIRHKPTGRYIPRPPSGRKGGSWAEPTPLDKQPPRFFHRERDAKGFLTAWLKGPVLARQYQTFDGDYDVDIGPNIKRAKEPRIKDEYEVVEIFWGIKDAN